MQDEPVADIRIAFEMDDKIAQLFDSLQEPVEPIKLQDTNSNKGGAERFVKVKRTEKFY